MNTFSWSDFFKNRQNKRNRKSLREQIPSGGSQGATNSLALAPGSGAQSMMSVDEKWDGQGFNQAFSGGGAAGWLYYCDGTTPYQEIKMGNGVNSSTGNSTSDSNGDAIQIAIINDVNFGGNYQVDNGNGK